MKALEGVRRKMKVNERKWEGKKVNEREKRKVKEVEEAMLHFGYFINNQSRIWLFRNNHFLIFGYLLSNQISVLVICK